MNAAIDTIVAIATPPGRGGVGVVRISGPAVPDLAQRLLARLPPPRQAVLTPVRDARGEELDRGLALYFPAPRSYTGEDVLEFHGHGGPVVMDLVLAAALDAGARLARPGEFTERAFLNGKLDLAQAEAVADLIDSGSREAARLALRSLEGAFSQRVQALAAEATELRTFVEAAIDFSDEDLDFMQEGEVGARLQRLREAVSAIQEAARQGAVMREGMTVVIAGRPNAGKSSLLNALAGRETAIVTDIPGTTRDVLREHISVGGIPLHVLDTAGLRESTDPVEQEGVRRAWEAIGRADRVLLVVDAMVGRTVEDDQLLARLPPELAVTVVYNKIDLSGAAAASQNNAVWLSARGGDGLDLLRDHLREAMGVRSGVEGLFLARRRHLDALARTGQHLSQAATVLAAYRAGELLAEELRLAQLSLGEITGEVTSDDLLGHIFSSFCIGK